jgi:hypothetical protein
MFGNAASRNCSDLAGSTRQSAGTWSLPTPSVRSGKSSLQKAKCDGRCRYIMFVRFRQTESRLQVSLVETRRIDGKVRHEHIASFGSVGVPPSVEDRIAFWQRLHRRLAKLSNRIHATAQTKLLGDVHARIPMVMLDEQRALQLRNAEVDERFWTNLHDMHAETVEGQRGLAASVERRVAEGKAEMAKAASHRDAARKRRERLQRGEDVPGGLGKPHTREDFERILREVGWTASDIQRSIDINKLQQGPSEYTAILFDLIIRRTTLKFSEAFLSGVIQCRSCADPPARRI